MATLTQTKNALRSLLGTDTLQVTKDYGDGVIYYNVSFVSPKTRINSDGETVPLVAICLDVPGEKAAYENLLLTFQSLDSSLWR